MRLVLKKNELTIGTNFAIGETRFRLPLHLLRFTVCSFAFAHEPWACADANAQFLGSWLYAVWPPRSAQRVTHAGGLLMIRPRAVEPRRFELLTFSLQRRRSTS